MAGESYVDHEVLAQFAQDRVNVSKKDAQERRTQVNYLRERLAGYIAEHPYYDLVKLRASGSTAKHTAIRRRSGEGSDADVAAYVRSNDPDQDEAGLLDWLRDRCIEVYGKTKVAEDFVISHHAVGITLRASGLKIDVAPVLYTGEPDDLGHLVTRQGNRVLTSVTLHLRFIEKRKHKNEAGSGYTELIRLLKAWIREAKRQDTDLRCKSFLLELLVAHPWDNGWNGEPLQVDDYPRAIEQVLAYIVRTGLKTPIAFADFYDPAEVMASSDAIQVWDPVNPENNVASTYTEADRQRLVDQAATALDAVSWAATTPNKGDANDAWRTLFGPSFEGA
ncbi:CBASS oligonucleotide cyclase [Streptacidiphilus sp. N1-3]|uniref:CBASS oligonucleotide cyclase n=1 Tax=Streptacidiphilus alkalitolerans TaxID=3342712 RepID=A0ABV6X5C7_9ACTN